MIDDFIVEYKRYRMLGERALARIPDAMLNHVPAPDGNSAAMLVYHISGNLASRFSDFLASDGEKPWRARDEEFADRACTRIEVGAKWLAGWRVLEETLASLTEADLGRTVTIRQQPLSVHAALCRSSAHMAYHVGQLVLIARTTAVGEWESLSIPKGTSEAYNAQPTREKAPQ